MKPSPNELIMPTLTDLAPCEPEPKKKETDLLNNCPPFGTYLRIATPINKISKLALELCIETSNFAAI